MHLRSRAALAAIATWSLLSGTTLLESEPSPHLHHQDSTYKSSFPKSALPNSTHSATVVLAQFLKDRQVELEEEAERERASEIHHPTRRRRRQIHLTRQ